MSDKAYVPQAKITKNGYNMFKNQDQKQAVNQIQK